MQSRTGEVSTLRHLDLATFVAGWVVSAIVASVTYVVWSAVSLTFVGLGTTHVDLMFGLGLAIFFLFAGGFAVALILMIIPWAIAVWAHFKTRWDDRIYFPGVGALLVFVLGCASASISPKPLFIEDQTSPEGALIAAQRQGLCFLICGIVFGACYCGMERRTRAKAHHRS